jgi:hypothetical protein
LEVRTVTETLPAEWRVSDGTVPLSDVARTAQCSYASIDYAARNGLISVRSMGGRDGRGNVRRISVEDALLVLAVAALAALAGLAFGAVFKAAKNSGATVGPSGLTFPIRGVA